MKAALQIFGVFFAFILFLSITINDRPIFSHIYGVISPMTKYAQSGVESFFNKSFDSTQAYSKKLFSNSVPKIKDSVDSRLSSQKKNGVAAPLEKINEDEKEELDQLIKNH